MNLYKKALAAALAAVCFNGVWSVDAAEARVHGGMAVEHHTVNMTDGTFATNNLAVNMNVDGIHPKYSNRVPASWQPVDTVDVKERNTMEPQMMKIWPVTSHDGDGTLIFSDSPEYVKDNGILYQDVVEGSGRIFYYHLNESRKNKKLAVVLENTTDKLATFEITRAGLSKPSSDYPWVGKQAETAYMASDMDEKLFVLPKGARIMDKMMDETIVHPGELVNGIYDFVTDKPVKISVIMYPADARPVEFAKKAKILPRDEVALRGTYQGMNRYITADKAYDPDRDGAVYMPLCDNLHDMYKTGVDATDGAAVTNYGNYGVMYYLDIPTEGKGETQYAISPLGGVYAGAMTVKEAGDDKASLIATPRHDGYYGDKTTPESVAEVEAWKNGVDYINDGTELTDLGIYDSFKKIRFEFSPPGASNLPVNFIMMPARQGRGLAYKWKKG